MGWSSIYLDDLSFSDVDIYSGGSKNPGFIGSWTNNSGAAISVVANVVIITGIAYTSEVRILGTTIEDIGLFDNDAFGEVSRPDDNGYVHVKSREIIVYNGKTVSFYLNCNVSSTVGGNLCIYKSHSQLLMDALDAVKAKSDLLAFTGTDVKATLDGEAVKLAADGWDSLAITEPSGDPDGWTVAQKLMWLIMRFLNETSSDNYDGIKVRKSDGTVATKQAVTEANGVKTVARAE